MEKHDNIVERKCMKFLEKALIYEATDIHLVPTKEGYDVFIQKRFET